MKAGMDGFQQAKFHGGYLNHVGPFYIRRLDGRYQVGLEVLETHVNYVDIAHGGVLTALADVALSYPVYRAEEPPRAVVTTSLTTNFLNAARLGDFLVADAWVDKLGKRSAHVHGHIGCGDTTIATMSGVFGIGPPVG